MKHLMCDNCKKPFHRENKYFDSPFDNVLFRLKRIYCDNCVDVRIKTALKCLPTVIEALAYSFEAAPDPKKPGR